MKVIKDNEGKTVSRLTVISKYFRKPDETLASFQAQLKALTEDDREELAIGAAKEIGYTVEDAVSAA